MTKSFDPEAPENNRPKYVGTPGRHVVQIVAGFPHSSEKGLAAVVCSAEVLLGDEEGKRVSKMFMMEGNGASYFADLCRSVRCKGIDNIEDLEELSQKLGYKPFAALCRWGRARIDNDGNARLDANGNPERFMEIREVGPITKEERQQLLDRDYNIRSETDVIAHRGQNADGSLGFDGDDDIPF